MEEDGWCHVGGKGDHRKFRHPSKPGHVVVPLPT
ncbi:type II toxin-antitoxin system HicA family toxin [Geomonas sp. Red259]|uniref:Type II toxin-antitoxin system HicA family toxin n=1 Tax=Geomonas propionica TaxID=2798582 RepID=A0ABS0YWY6_9BACT|nr:type II toxin-antitoxin system HicA family toxin [Geomonas propionica]